MDPKANSLNWFEIPASDIARAKAFYENIFNMKMYEMEMGDMTAAMFPAEPKSGKANGCLAKSPMHTPATEGSVIYLNANPEMSGVLGKIEAAGGKIVLPKTSIGPNGFMAFFIDTEGNKVGLHSQN
jgi:uncharacterized protein